LLGTDSLEKLLNYLDLGEQDPGQLHSTKQLTRKHAAAKTPSKQRREKVSQTVDSICSHAFNYGLNNTSIARIVNIISRKNELDQTSLTNLIKNLYPAQKVQDDVVLAIISGLGQGGNKPSLATQTALVRWIIAVYDVLETRTILSSAYGVLFGLLDMLSLRYLLSSLN
jgi:centromere protein I